MKASIHFHANSNSCLQHVTLIVRLAWATLLRNALLAPVSSKLSIQIPVDLAVKSQSMIELFKMENCNHSQRWDTFLMMLYLLLVTDCVEVHSKSPCEELTDATTGTAKCSWDLADLKCHGTIVHSYLRCNHFDIILTEHFPLFG